MKPTLQQCYDQARAATGDDAISGGEEFTNQVLEPHASQSIRELFRVLRQAQDPFVLAEAYFVLPPNTSVLDPATAGITDLAEPEFVEWNTSPPATAITNVVVTPGDTPYADVTAPGHGLGVNTVPTVVVYGVTGFDAFNSPNQSWSALVVDANTIRLNGCTATMGYISGGYVVPVTTTGRLLPMDARDRIEDIAAVPGDAGQTGAEYAWEGGVFRFLPSSQSRLLRITYRTSGLGDLGLTSIVPIDDCQDYISVRAAGLALASHGASGRAAELRAEAIGPGMDAQADGSGGILGQLLRSSIRAMQREQYRQMSFRARRNREDTQMW